MALQKQNLNINFAQGLDLKIDPKQVQAGKFLLLQNSIFEKGGLLQKRNGYQPLTSLPDTSYQYTTTFNGNLTAIGSRLAAYNSGGNAWVDKGSLQNVDLNTLPLIRNNTNQTQTDAAISPNGLVCTVYTDVGSTTTYKYAIADSVTGQNIVAPTIIDANQTGSPRVFVLGSYFIIMYSSVIAAVNHLQYIAINYTVPTLVTSPADISTSYSPNSRVDFDAAIANNTLYIAFNGSDGGGAVRVTSLSFSLTLGGVSIFAGRRAETVSVSADLSGATPVIWVAFKDPVANAVYTLAVNQIVNTILAPVVVEAIAGAHNVSVSVLNLVATIIYEIDNNYSYDASIPSHFLKKNTVTQAGVVGTPSVLVRSVGLASKSFIVDSVIYFLSVYKSDFQPSYFLMDQSGKVIARLAYSNGSGYLNIGLPSVSVSDTTAYLSYLIKDLILPVNKTQGVANSAGVYAQTGINLASFDISTGSIVSSEIGNNLNLSGGFLWGYDGYTPVESNFFLWPDNVEVTTSAAGGNLSDQQYFYQATYEWSDNQGNIFRSAPSIPISITTAGSGTSSNTINIPTLRLTYKTANPVKIVLYRWSTAQQTYYQVTSVTSPLMNSTTTDSVSFVDTLSDAAILGNSIIYTTGGVIENIGPPATALTTLFKSRLFLVDAEDRNLLWFSKQVIESTPVEMSDLFTIYVAPTTSAQGSTGVITAMASLDDKLILFKTDGIYYITGTGPDNTGSNNDFSEPVFITATVGCSNQNSIVFMPQGLMFQSDKGIWLLDRGLSTTYIGAPVEDFNQFRVQSAVNIPGTNQVRFTLSNGITLMYDYYFSQWGTFQGVPAVSSTLYQNLHTYFNSLGQVFQENPGSYMDASSPVLMKFTTSWLSFAGIQGFERAYFFYLLGTYITPHKLTVDIAYDFDPSIVQSEIITPDNFVGKYGSDSLYGGSSPYGGISTIEQWRVFLERQKCQSFQITLTESYDSSMGVVAGAGFTLSGIDLIFAAKGIHPRLPASRSVG